MRKQLYAAIAVVSALPFLASCSAEDTEMALNDGEKTVMENFVDENFIAEYKLADLDQKTIDGKQLTGDDIHLCLLSFPFQYVVYNGKMWRDRHFNSVIADAGSTRLVDLILWAYSLETGFDSRILVESRIHYNAENNRIDLPWHDSSLTYSKPGEFTIEYDCSCDHAPAHTSYITYRRVSTEETDISNCLFFETLKDADLHIIQLVREEFGNEFNINNYLRGYAILTDPIINLDDVEKDVRENYGKYAGNM